MVEENINKATERKETEKTNNSFIKSLVSILTGKFLVKEETVSHLPFLLFLTVLALIYIANGYYAEDTIRKLNTTNIMLKELQSEYISTKSSLMVKSKLSEVEKAVTKQNIGLQAPITPPNKIVIKKDDLK